MTSESGVETMARRYDKQQLLNIRAIARTDGDIPGRISRVTGVEDCVAFDKVNVSTSSISNSHDQSSSTATNPFEGYEPPPNDEFFFRNNKCSWSPTASVRGAKARAFVEQHGSPPGFRVTAGGKVVHDGTVLGLHRIMPVVEPSWFDGKNLIPFNGCLFFNNDGTGRITQIVDGRAMPAGGINGLNLHQAPTNQLVFPNGAPNMLPATQPQPLTQQPLNNNAQHASGKGQAPMGVMMTAENYAVEQQIQQLEMRMSQTQANLRELNRADVLMRGANNNNNHTQQALTSRKVVQGRVALTNDIDAYRRQIMHLKEQLRPRVPMFQPYASFQPVPVGPPPMFFPPPPMQGVPNMQMGMMGPMQTYPNSMSYDHTGQNGQMMLPVPQQQILHAGPTNSLDNQASFDQGHGEGNALGNDQNKASLPVGLGVQYPTFASKFQANAPEFVPFSLASGNQHASTQDQQLAAKPQLQERSANVALTTSPAGDKVDSTRKTPTVTGAYNTAAINLDGSGPQFRLSHAIEIKKPVEYFGEPTADQSRQESVQITTSRGLSKLHGPREIAQNAGRVVQPPSATVSPVRSCNIPIPRSGEPLVRDSNDSFATERSADTADFFPHSANEHTMRNWAAGSQDHEDLSGWLSKQGQSSVATPNATPVETMPKYHFRDESAGDEPTLRGAVHHLVSQAPVSALSSSDERDYARGFQVGQMYEVASPSGNLEYMRGYRDGLYQAAKTNQSDLQHGDRPSRCHSNGPLVPSNTATSTPVSRSFSGHASKVLDNATSGAPASHSFASSTAENHGVSAVADIPNVIDKTPPLSNRKSVNQVQSWYGGGRIFSAPKVQTSTASTAQHAKGCFVAQLDGSNEDEDNQTLAERSANEELMPDASPAEEKGKAKAPGSPIKRASSVASSAYRRLTSLGGISKDKSEEPAQTRSKKEDDPAKMSSPEKARWKAKWASRFTDLKKEDQEWMHDYHRKNPLP